MAKKDSLAWKEVNSFQKWNDADDEVKIDLLQSLSNLELTEKEYIFLRRTIKGLLTSIWRN